MDNRIPAPDPADALALRPIDWTLFDLATDAARRSPRRRQVLRFHELAERLQRMVNAVEPDSYVQPHRHSDPPKVEVFVCVRGRAVIVRFDAAGTVVEQITLAAGGPAHGVEISAGAWHTLFALDPGTVLFEVKEGPYTAATDKEFAPWAPPEADGDAALAYLRALRERVGVPFEHAPLPADEDEDDLC